MKHLVPVLLIAALAAPTALWARTPQTAIGRQQVRQTTVPKPDPREIEVPGIRTGHTVPEIPSAVSGPVTPTARIAANPLPQRAAATRELRANILYHYRWGSQKQYQIVSIKLSDAYDIQTVELGPYGEYGAVFFDDKYLTLTPEMVSGELNSIFSTLYNADTWEIKGSQAYLERFVRAFDMTYDATTGRIYGCFNTYDNKPYFGYMRKPTSSQTPLSVKKIVDLGEIWGGIAADANGNLFALNKDGVLYRVDKETGATETVAETGAKTKYLCSATIDPASGILYYTPNTDTYSRLYAIDTTTGAATVLKNFSNYEQLIGLYIPKPSASDKAPDQVTSLTLDFAGTSMTGTATFTLPTALYDGSEATGQADYTVTVGGKEAAKGSADYGSTVSAPISVETPGEYTVEVKLSNDAGSGPARSVSRYIGPDTPVAPKNAKLSYDRSTGEMSIMWLAPSKGVNGTTLNRADLVYNIRSYPSGRLVSAGQSATDFSETVEMPETLTEFYYTIEAVNDGYTSEPVATNTISIGAITPPYEIGFHSAADFSQCTVINDRPTTQKWAFFTNWGGCASVRYEIQYDMDDWLLLPPMKLKGGESYKISFKAGCRSTDYERIEVKAGTEPTAEAMTIGILDPTDLKVDFQLGGEIIDCYLNAPTTATYYIGFHGISDKDKNRLCLSDVTIAAGITPHTPGMPTDLTVTPEATGALKATVFFKAPATANDGSDLSSLSRIDISRNGELIKTINPAPAPGADCTYFDTTPCQGENTYEVTAYNLRGKGKTASITTFVGFAAPSPLQGVKASRGTNNGEIEINWQPVETDVNGLKLTAADITYNLVRLDGDTQIEVAAGLTETSCRVQAVKENATQQFVQYAVLPVSIGGVGVGMSTGLVAVGRHHTLPFEESWKNRKLTYNWGFEGTGGVMPIDDDYFSDFTSLDTDNGSLLIYGDFEGDYVDLISGIVDIPANAVNPRLVYHFYAMRTAENTIETLVSADGGDFTSLDRTVLAPAEGAKEGWRRMVLALDDFKGKSIQIKFHAVRVNMKNTILDAIKIYDQPSDDLSAIALRVPDRATAGEPVNLAVEFENLGTNDARGYNVDIFRNNKIVASLEGPAVKAGESASVEFSDPTNTTMGTRLSYRAEIDFGADGNTGNNATATVKVALDLPEYPAPESLTASRDGDNVTLEWTAPDKSKTPIESRLHDFESAEPFSSTDLQGWTTVKIDDGINGALEGLTFPGITPGESSVPFFVLDNAAIGDDRCNGHSGQKSLACVYNADPDTQMDVLLISPELCGQAHTVTFWARSFLRTFPEDFEVVCSSTGNRPEDFAGAEPVLSVTSAPFEWTSFAAKVPEGTRYVAIRVVSLDKYMFMIDDIDLRLAECQPIAMTLVGYNIYRNGTRLNASPVSELRFSDTCPTAADYLVTAVYDLGESLPGPKAQIEAGIASVGNDSQPDAEIFNPLGVRVTNTTPNGVYIIRRGDKIEKVMTK